MIEKYRAYAGSNGQREEERPAAFKSPSAVRPEISGVLQRLVDDAREVFGADQSSSAREPRSKNRREKSGKRTFGHRPRIIRP